jgi:hypothetical protein
MNASAFKEEIRLRSRFSNSLRSRSRFEQFRTNSVAVISVNNDAAEVQLEVALSTALLVGCNVDCVDIKISTGIVFFHFRSQARWLGLPRLASMWYLVPESTIDRVPATTKF